MVESERRLTTTHNPWMAAEQNPRLEIHSQGLSFPERDNDVDGINGFSPAQSESQLTNPKTMSDGQLVIAERAFSAAGAAFLSAIIVNPLDVAKVYIYILRFSFLY